MRVSYLGLMVVMMKRGCLIRMAAPSKATCSFNLEMLMLQFVRGIIAKHYVQVLRGILDSICF